MIKLWVKNVGSQPVQPIEASDVFLQTATDAQRLGWNGSAAVGCNCWRYEIENGSAWTQTVTVQFIVFPASVDSGSYRATVTVANGVSALGVSALKDFSVQ